MQTMFSMPSDRPRDTQKATLAAIKKAQELDILGVVPRDNSFVVPSTTSYKTGYEVKMLVSETGTIWLTCECKAGEFRTEYPVPCKHAALVGIHLVRAERATFHEGEFRTP